MRGKPVDPKTIELVESIVRDNKTSIKDACNKAGIAVTTYYKAKSKNAAPVLSDKPKRKYKVRTSKPVTIPYAEPAPRPASGRGNVVALIGTPGEIARALSGFGFGDQK